MGKRQYAGSWSLPGESLSRMEILIVIVGIAITLYAIWPRVKAARGPAASVIVDCPLIPALTNARTYECDSFTEENVTYTVDLQKLNCTCPDWRKRWGQQPPNSPVSLCKHLRAMLAKAHREELGPALTAALEDDFISQARWVHKTTIESNTIIISGYKSGGWINIWAPKSQKNKTKTSAYERYGFNPFEERWAYNRKPQQAAELLVTLKKLTPIA